MDKARHASVEVSLGWACSRARHLDRYLVTKVNLWRDFFPGRLAKAIAGLSPGDTASERFPVGDILPAPASAQIHRVPRAKMTRRLGNGRAISPRLGRFYPRGLLDGVVADAYPEDRRPVRVVDEDGDRVAVDFNHPLAAYELEVAAQLLEWQDAKEEHGERCNDIVLDSSAEGPGLQGALADRDTVFYADEPFMRGDPRPDDEFYRPPRLVNHIDTQARRHVQAIYARALRPGMRVLDLMSSWTSHLPDAVPDLRVTGLGMNAVELAANPCLADWTIHDLNQDPRLPFAEGTFDAAICTVSVEYLTRPVEVLTEVARVLEPGAPFVVIFSERWFPPKVVRIWTELHPFERMGLVVDYFRRSGGFEDLATESVRGWRRPADDKYFPQLILSDPIYAVSGRRRAG